MTPGSGFDALRAGATLTHALPLQLRLHHAGRVLAAVSRPPFAGAAGARLITPCAFRAAVGEAWRLQQAGHAVVFAGLPADVEPEATIEVPPSGEVRPGGIYQLPWADGVLSVFATTASAAIIERAAPPSVDAHLDRVTGVSLVRIAAADREADTAARALEDVLATITTEDLIAGLA